MTTAAARSAVALPTRSEILSLYRQLIRISKYAPASNELLTKYRMDFRYYFVIQSTDPIPLSALVKPTSKITPPRLFVDSLPAEPTPEQTLPPPTDEDRANYYKRGKSELSFHRMKIPARLWRKSRDISPEQKSTYVNESNPTVRRYVATPFGDIREVNEGGADQHKRAVANHQGLTEEQYQRNARLMERFRFGGNFWKGKHKR